MNKPARTFKLFPVWIAVSAVILLAGIVLFALLGFNTSAERPESKTVDVSYNVSVALAPDGEETLEEICETAFEQNGLRYDDKTLLDEQSAPVSSTQTGFTPTGAGWLLRYTFAADTDDADLAAVVTAIRTEVEAALGAQTFPAAAEVNVSSHTLVNQSMNEAIWRGAVGLAVGVVVALAYVGLRFGAGAAVTGLTMCVHDALLTLAFFAITRIPVYSFAPLLFAAIAAVVSVALWLVRCAKLRDIAKEPATASLPAGDAVGEACAATDKTVLAISGVLAAVFAVCAACIPVGGALIAAPAIACFALTAYSSMLFAPALHVPVKAAFDRLKAKRRRYAGKTKSEKSRSDKDASAEKISG